MVQPLKAEQCLGNRPPLVEPADHIVSVDSDVFESDLAKLLVPFDIAYRTNCDPGCRELEQEEADTLLL